MHNYSDGPSFYLGGPSEKPTQNNVSLGDPLSLVCGTGLESNPQATITWTAPDGSTLMNNVNDRYTVENGPEIVRLNISGTVLNDNGMWLCEVLVTSDRHIARNGTLVLAEQTVIGIPIIHQFVVTLSAGEFPMALKFKACSVLFSNMVASVAPAATPTTFVLSGNNSSIIGAVVGVIAGFLFLVIIVIIFIILFVSRKGGTQYWHYHIDI